MASKNRLVKFLNRMPKLKIVISLELQFDFFHHWSNIQSTGNLCYMWASMQMKWKFRSTVLIWVWRDTIIGKGSWIQGYFNADLAVFTAKNPPLAPISCPLRDLYTYSQEGLHQQVWKLQRVGRIGICHIFVLNKN